MNPLRNTLRLAAMYAIAAACLAHSFSAHADGGKRVPDHLSLIHI